MREMESQEHQRLSIKRVTVEKNKGGKKKEVGKKINQER